ncbi:MAG: hypothetical protein M3Q54_08585 [Actinomycetota bacterium]|nr:hypothetical protein [Rubrobacter sp.]MBA3790476.1 hypothetical protein [Rubrobacter sp.]MDQ3237579.1 hypothetical protein [Actinomycetota bacterium]MDQ3637807.1 hypothetical protein [Actinomycetota bacterium]
MKNVTKRQRWYEAFAPSGQMFHGAGKGMGRGRGPRLAEAPRNESSGGVRDKVAA